MQAITYCCQILKACSLLYQRLCHRHDAAKCNLNFLGLNHVALKQKNELPRNIRNGEEAEEWTLKLIQSGCWNVLKNCMMHSASSLNNNKVIFQDNKFCCIVIQKCGFCKGRASFYHIWKVYWCKFFCLFSIFLFILFVRGIIVARICILPILFILDSRNILWETALS